MEMMIWNVALSGIVGVMIMMLRGKFEELQRISVLLNRTREEMARDHITRSEFRADTTQILDRFDRLELKIDQMIKDYANR